VSERVFGFSEPYNGDLRLSILRRNYPDRKFPDDFQSGKDIYNIVPRARAEELLRELGQKGWTPLEESVIENTKDLVQTGVVLLLAPCAYNGQPIDTSLRHLGTRAPIFISSPYNTYSTVFMCRTLIYYRSAWRYTVMCT
jgi:hypothetical protein